MTELIDRLKEHKEWAEANSWEVPITLPDDIAEAIEALSKNGMRCRCGHCYVGMDGTRDKCPFGYERK